MDSGDSAVTSTQEPQKTPSFVVAADASRASACADGGEQVSNDPVRSGNGSDGLSSHTNTTVSSTCNRDERKNKLGGNDGAGSGGMFAMFGDGAQSPPCSFTRATGSRSGGNDSFQGGVSDVAAGGIVTDTAKEKSPTSGDDGGGSSGGLETRDLSGAERRETIKGIGCIDDRSNSNRDFVDSLNGKGGGSTEFRAIEGEGRLQDRRATDRRGYMEGRGMMERRGRMDGRARSCTREFLNRPAFFHCGSSFNGGGGDTFLSPKLSGGGSNSIERDYLFSPGTGLGGSSCSSDNVPPPPPPPSRSMPPPGFRCSPMREYTPPFFMDTSSFERAGGGSGQHQLQQPGFFSPIGAGGGSNGGPNGYGRPRGGAVRDGNMGFLGRRMRRRGGGMNNGGPPFAGGRPLVGNEGDGKDYFMPPFERGDERASPPNFPAPGPSLLLPPIPSAGFPPAPFQMPPFDSAAAAAAAACMLNAAAATAYLSNTTPASTSCPAAQLGPGFSSGGVLVEQKTSSEGTGVSRGGDSINAPGGTPPIPVAGGGVLLPQFSGTGLNNSNQFFTEAPRAGGELSSTEIPNVLRLDGGSVRGDSSASGVPNAVAPFYFPLAHEGGAGPLDNVFGVAPPPNLLQHQQNAAAAAAAAALPLLLLSRGDNTRSTIGTAAPVGGVQHVLPHQKQQQQQIAAAPPVAAPMPQTLAEMLTVTGEREKLKKLVKEELRKEGYNFTMLNYVVEKIKQKGGFEAIVGGEAELLSLVRDEGREKIPLPVKKSLITLVESIAGRDKQKEKEEERKKAAAAEAAADTLEEATENKSEDAGKKKDEQIKVDGGKQKMSNGGAEGPGKSNANEKKKDVKSSVGQKRTASVAGEGAAAATLEANRSSSSVDPATAQKKGEQIAAKKGIPPSSRPPLRQNAKCDRVPHSIDKHKRNSLSCSRSSSSRSRGTSSTNRSTSSRSRRMSSRSRRTSSRSGSSRSRRTSSRSGRTSSRSRRTSSRSSRTSSRCDSRSNSRSRSSCSRSTGDRSRRGKGGALLQRRGRSRRTDSRSSSRSKDQSSHSSSRSYDSRATSRRSRSSKRSCSRSRSSSKKRDRDRSRRLSRRGTLNKRHRYSRSTSTGTRSIHKESSGSRKISCAAAASSTEMNDTRNCAAEAGSNREKKGMQNPSATETSNRERNGIRNSTAVPASSNKVKNHMKNTSAAARESLSSSPRSSISGSRSGRGSTRANSSRRPSIDLRLTSSQSPAQLRLGLNTDSSTPGDDTKSTVKGRSSPLGSTRNSNRGGSCSSREPRDSSRDRRFSGSRSTRGKSDVRKETSERKRNTKGSSSRAREGSRGSSRTSSKSCSSAERPCSSSTSGRSHSIGSSRSRRSSRSGKDSIHQTEGDSDTEATFRNNPSKSAATITVHGATATNSKVAAAADSIKEQTTLKRKAAYGGSEPHKRHEDRGSTTKAATEQAEAQRAAAERAAAERGAAEGAASGRAAAQRPGQDAAPQKRHNKRKRSGDTSEKQRSGGELLQQQQKRHLHGIHVRTDSAVSSSGGNSSTKPTLKKSSKERINNSRGKDNSTSKTKGDIVQDDSDRRASVNHQHQQRHNKVEKSSSLGKRKAAACMPEAASSTHTQTTSNSAEGSKNSGKYATPRAAEKGPNAGIELTGGGKGRATSIQQKTSAAANRDLGRGSERKERESERKTGGGGTNNSDAGNVRTGTASKDKKTLHSSTVTLTATQTQRKEELQPHKKEKDKTRRSNHVNSSVTHNNSSSHNTSTHSKTSHNSHNKKENGKRISSQKSRCNTSAPKG